MTDSTLDSINDLLSAFQQPVDPDLSALLAHCAAHPKDEVAILVLADRYDELSCSFLASICRLQAYRLLYERTVFDTIVRSLGIPAHIFSPPRS
jgi:hypothetical protein